LTVDVFDLFWAQLPLRDKFSPEDPAVLELAAAAN
jgi:hypothetical protein